MQGTLVRAPLRGLWRRPLAAVLLFAAAACAPFAPAPDGALRYSVPPMPEGPSGYSAKPGWAAERFMVAACAG